MHAIVSLLDKKHYQLVEDLWAELEREFSVHDVYITPYPHFSYHVAHLLALTQYCTFQSCAARN